jgi:nucleotide-binding universal stress UspA family protein
MKRILIATDGSDAAEEALETALELAEEHVADVTVVHVEPSYDLVVGSYLSGPVEVSRDEMPPDDDGVLERAAELAADRGVEARLVERSGYPPDEIARLANEIDADVVVVGSRGLGAVSEFILGSTSRALLRRTTRPVLVVRATRARVPA